MACYGALHNSWPNALLHRTRTTCLNKWTEAGIANGLRFRQTSPVRFNVASVSSNNPLGRPAAGQRHRSLCKRGGLFCDHAQCLRLSFRSACKKLHHPQLHNLLRLDTKHCRVAGDLHPVPEQYVPRGCVLDWTSSGTIVSSTHRRRCGNQVRNLVSTAARDVGSGTPIP